MSRNNEPCPSVKPVIHQLRIGPHAPIVPVPADQSLLQAAALAGIELPASCRNGTCRTCMRRLISGQVSYRIEWPGLSQEEKLQGWILPCVAYPRSDLVLADET